MGRFGRGLAMIGSSWRVLKSEPRLLVFPLLSLVASVALLVAIAAPFAIWPEMASSLQRAAEGTGEGPSRILTYGLLFLFYFATNFIVVFFNAALISCVMTRLAGGTVTVGSGLAAAAARLPQILAWAAFNATIGLILKAVEERLPFVGKIVLRLVGAAWAIVTFFVVPVVALERLGPFAAVKRSAQLIRQTWGESLVGNIGLGLIGFLLTLPGFLIIGLGVSAAASATSTALLIVAIGLGIAWFLAISTILSAMNQIFIASAYVYAIERRVPEGFTPELLDGAFRHK